MFFSYTILAQTATVDSLHNLLNQHTKQDTTRIKINYQLAKELSGHDSAAAINYLEAGHLLAKAINSKYYIAEYYQARADILYDRADEL